VGLAAAIFCLLRRLEASLREAFFSTRMTRMTPIKRGFASVALTGFQNEILS
jgi:hypothetical protein